MSKAKIKRGKVRLALLALVVAVAVLGSCTNPVFKKLGEQVLMGQWVNPDSAYTGWPFPSELTFKADQSVDWDDGSGTVVNSPYKIEDSWTASDGHYFKISLDRYNDGSLPEKILGRVSTDGSTFEYNVNAGSSTYADSFHNYVDGGFDYSILHRP